MSDGKGGWLTDKFKNFLPEELMPIILGQMSVMPNVGPDSLIWGAAHDGKFSTKSAYALINEGNGSNSRLWKLIWKNDLPQRIRCFLWMLAKKGLITNQECPKVANLWSLFNATQVDNQFSLSNLMIGLVKNLADTSDSALGVPWNLLFSITIWFIWKDRNEEIFTDKQASHFKHFSQDQELLCHSTPAITIAETRGMTNLFLESDSKVAVDLINKGCGDEHPCRQLVQAIRDLILKYPTIVIYHVLEKPTK
ncbi:Reverse transcriptase zinc-binding domain [Sesbania bispinosa]|nr:Reverse transcriptase zinc-binding domain [Sesbania bispinosa]